MTDELHPLRRDGLGRRALPFVLATLTAFVVLAVAEPPSYVSPGKELALIVAAAGIAVGCALAARFLPWRSLPRAAATVLPLAYLVMIALLREGAGGAVSGYGILVLVPVVWVALYGTRAELVLTLAGVALVFIVPILTLGAPGYPDSEWRRAILSGVVAAVVGIAIQSLVQQVRLRAREAREQADALDVALARQRRSEAELQAVITSAAEGMIAFDLVGAIVLANPAAAHMLGRNASELVGSRGAGILGEGPLHRALGGGVEAVVPNASFTRADGTCFPAEYRVTPLLAAGEHTGSLLVFRDITERRAVELLKDQFVSTVSHELRTPLTSIRGSLGLLAGGVAGDLPGEARQMVDIALSNAERLIRLINDILDVERIESGQVELEAVDTDAAAIVAAAVESVRGMADRRGIEIVVEAEAHPVRADFDRMVQVLTNILSNAVKFSDENAEVRVTVATDGEEVRFSVADKGRGIPPDRLAAVFERFQQVDASDARDRGGTGLGLAITRSIVEQHQGRVWVDSEVGRGSTFHVALPAPAAGGSGAGPRVLVVDDDARARRTLSRLLEARGYSVTGAGSGEEALELAQQRPPSAIVLDLLMPGISGWETLSALKAHDATRDVPVMIVSVLAADGRGRPVQAEGWLPKDMDTGDLVSALEGALRTYNLGRVLVVEDDLDLALVLAEAFRRHKIETFTARTVADAVELSARVEPDLVVLDLGLPDGDGAEVLEVLRREGRLGSTPVVVYTARDLGTGERGDLDSLADVMRKSDSTPIEVAERVKRLLDTLAAR